MFMKTVAASVFILGLCQAAALAQSPSSSQSTATAPSSPAQASNQSLPDKIKQKLTAKGFTNVQVVPQSYLVNAKDKDGDPVTMLIGPNSMTVFTVVPEGSAPGTQSGAIKQ